MSSKRRPPSVTVKFTGAGVSIESLSLDELASVMKNVQKLLVAVAARHGERPPHAFLASVKNGSWAGEIATPGAPQLPGWVWNDVKNLALSDDGIDALRNINRSAHRHGALAGISAPGKKHIEFKLPDERPVILERTTISGHVIGLRSREDGGISVTLRTLVGEERFFAPSSKTRELLTAFQRRVYASVYYNVYHFNRETSERTAGSIDTIEIVESEPKLIDLLKQEEFQGEISFDIEQWRRENRGD